jgi:hypothetical protein
MTVTTRSEPAHESAVAPLFTSERDDLPKLELATPS